ncbi:MAG: lytic murein transglycosylase, partial [Sphingobacteriales bacterium]
MRRYSTVCILLLIAISGNLNTKAQEVFQLPVPEKTLALYAGTIADHKNVVHFIEQMLAQHGIPKMMSNLALIESGFDKQVISPAQAGGLWQLTEEHARHYGLNSNERFDIYHSTRAAIQTMKDLYQRYQNWITVVAAYNCGEGRVNAALGKSGSGDYLEYSRYLPAETKMHVRKFLEACYASGSGAGAMAAYHAPARMPARSSVQASAEQVSLITTSINAAMNTGIIADELGISTTA